MRQKKEKIILIIIMSNERRNANQRNYYAKHKDEILAKSKEYRTDNPKEKKRCQIKTWKKRGVICNDFSTLYDQYIQILNCENCGVEFGKWGDGSCTYRVLDHCHKTGEVRNYLCQRCNIYRGYRDNAEFY